MSSSFYFDDKYEYVDPEYLPVYNDEFSTIDQFYNDLIYILSKVKFAQRIIEYKIDGIYDRILTNFKEHIKESELTDNEKYEWNLLPENIKKMEQSNSFNQTW